MEHNPRALAQGFTLPLESGGHKVLLPPNSKTTIDLLDINMLAADMGVDFIPPEHPDAHNFLPRHLQSEDIFDLVLCDGNVLRTHPRAAYRDVREAARLVMAQLTMALEHMKPGGTILVLMHKMESWKFVLLLRTISRFSIVQVFKPRRGHAKRSSCYLVASNIQPQHEDAVEAVRTWKQLWKTATFGTEDEYEQLVRSLEPNVEDVLEDFGPRLIELGRNVWKTQADALATAPFVRNSRV
jgi:23S rRNA U2552 (ribose-2'-O)-methylase RlmE/FtsJ